MMLVRERTTSVTAPVGHDHNSPVNRYMLHYNRCKVFRNIESLYKKTILPLNNVFEKKIVIKCVASGEIQFADYQTLFR